MQYSTQLLTSESGVYVPDDDRWPAHFRGMGIRIEDSICVQKEHPVNLTTEAVKEVRACCTCYQSKTC
jgi:intermediate cleaving peptidase 55